MTPEEALKFVSDHGVVLESARGPVPNLVELAMPHGLVFDGVGNLYVADTGNNVVRRFAPQSSVPAASLISAVEEEEEVVASPPPSSVAQPGYGQASEVSAEDDELASSSPPTSVAQPGYGETQSGYGQ